MSAHPSQSNIPAPGCGPSHITARLRGLGLAAAGMFFLTACGAPAPAPVPTLIPTLAAEGAPSAGTPGPALAAPTLPPLAASPTATPPPVELVVCQTDEPLSLYLYGDDTPARAGILEALYDGPIDLAGYEPRPVILEELPSVANGRLRLETVGVAPGDRVVDAVTWQVVQLAEGVRLAQADGSVITYTGAAPAPVVQVSAEFQLRAGLLWSDSQPLTAEDSRFSFEAAAYYDTPVSKFITDRTLAYEVLDRLTTRWTGLPGWRDREAARRFWSPLPRHLFDGVNPSELKANPDANARPVGWGAFQLESWQTGERLTLVRNPNYFRAAEGLPKVDRLVFRFGLMPEQILDEMRAGRCDIGPRAVDFSGLLAELRSDPAAFAPQFAPGLVFEHLDFSLQPAPADRIAAGRAALQDRRVRQAIAYCLDRPALIHQFADGVGEPPSAYLPAGHPLLAAGLPTYAFDVERGRSLLAEAGWADTDGDGVRDQAGQPLALTYASGPETSAYRAGLARALAEQLAACGIQVRAAWYAVDDPAQGLYAPWPAGPIFGRRFDLAGFPWRAGLEPPCELYLASAIPDDLNPAGANAAGYANPEFDAACWRALNAYDPAERQSGHAAAQALFARDLPALPLFFRPVAGVTRPGVSGYQLDAAARSDLWNIEALGAP